MSARIVVGFVQSPAGERALEWAAQRAAADQAQLLLVAVVAGAVGTVGEGSVLDEVVASVSAELDERALKLRESGFEVEVEVRRGNPVTQLISASAEASLLVLGSDYRDRFDGPSRGVNGIRIAAGSSCPVVVVPDVGTTERSGVVVGVDGSEVSEAAIAFAAAEADRLHEPLIAVTVWTPLTVPFNAMVDSGEYVAGLQAQSNELLALSIAGLRQDYPDLVIDPRVERGYPSQVINGLASTARLAVVGTHGRGRIAQFLLGSISHEVLVNLATVTAVVR